MYMSDVSHVSDMDTHTNLNALTHSPTQKHTPKTNTYILVTHTHKHTHTHTYTRENKLEHIRSHWRERERGNERVRTGRREGP